MRGETSSARDACGQESPLSAMQRRVASPASADIPDGRIPHGQDREDRAAEPAGYAIAGALACLRAASDFRGKRPAVPFPGLALPLERLRGHPHPDLLAPAASVGYGDDLSVLGVAGDRSALLSGAWDPVLHPLRGRVSERQRRRRDARRRCQQRLDAALDRRPGLHRSDDSPGRRPGLGPDVWLLPVR